MNSSNHYLKSAHLFMSLAVLAMALLSRAAFATDIETLVNAGEMKVSVEQVASETVVPKQPIKLDITVESLYPITEDIKVQYFDIESTVVQPETNLRMNSRVVTDDVAWFTQKIRVVIYPLTAGKLTIPQVGVTANIEHKDGTKIKGELFTQAQDISVNEIPNVATSDQLIVSPKASFSVSVQSENQESYEAGQAVDITYTLSAEDLHTIMLPDLEETNIDGVETYYQPAIDENIDNRLTKLNTATRKQTVTLIFNEGGEFELPARTFEWWNSKTGELESLEVSSLKFRVEGGSRASVALTSSWSAIKSFVSGGGKYLVVILLFVALSLRAIIKHFPQLKAYYLQKSRAEIKQLERQFIQSIDVKDSVAALNTIYKIAHAQQIKTTSITDSFDDHQLETWRKLLAGGFQKYSAEEISVQDAESILTAMGSDSSKSKHKQGFRFSWDLNSNA